MMQRRFGFSDVVYVLTGLLTLSLALGSALAQEGTGEKPKTPPPAPEKKADMASLYQRVGGAGPIAVVIDDFINRMYANDKLNANPKVKAASEKAPAAVVKFHTTNLVCQMAGGPEKYTGRPLDTVHEPLGITDAEWDAMAADLKASMDKFKVPAQEQEDMMKLLESTKGDIVGHGHAHPGEKPHSMAEPKIKPEDLKTKR